MTLTLIARNPYTRQLGLAMASGSDDCVGGGVVAAALQGQYPAMLVLQGKKGDGRLHEQLAAMQVQKQTTASMMEWLQAHDSALPLRQVLLAPLDGDFRAMTGSHCPHYAGHLLEEHLVVAGNMLASDKTLAAMRGAYLADMNAPMRRRLFAALAAGIAAGGDLRGHASAGIMVAGDQPFACRVTATPRPLDDLAAALSA